MKVSRGRYVCICSDFPFISFGSALGNMHKLSPCIVQVLSIPSLEAAVQAKLSAVRMEQGHCCCGQSTCADVSAQWEVDQEGYDSILGSASAPSITTVTAAEARRDDDEPGQCASISDSAAPQGAATAAHFMPRCSARSSTASWEEADLKLPGKLSLQVCLRAGGRSSA